jgi:ribulose-phosphate 3-epimerase
MIRIYPSLLAADPKHLQEEVTMLEPYCAGFHLDVMDNSFVTNVALSIDTVNRIAQRGKPVWVHLMVEKPDLFYTQFFLPTDSLISFHIESQIDVLHFVKIIREKKHKASIAINPKTPLEHIIPFLDIVDQILIMSVEPGHSGQHFLEKSFEKIAALITYRQKSNYSLRVGVDGGINQINIKKLIETGAQDFAIGSGIFNHDNSLGTLHKLEKSFDTFFEDKKHSG